MKYRFTMAIVLLCIIAFGVQLSHAQYSEIPYVRCDQPINTAGWWPDPTTGLMWTGRMYSKGLLESTNWKEANDYCASLKLGGYSGWRLPTLDEMKAIACYYRVFYDGNSTYDALVFKGIYLTWPSQIWTSTLNDDQTAWVGLPGGPQMTWHDSHYRTDNLTNHLGHAVICARPMEAEILQIAKDAQVNKPVPDVLTLKADVPLHKARLAYRAGQYQESIAQAKNALLVKPDFAPAYWAIGISYGMSDQWDRAITNLEAALKIDKDYGDAKDALKWAKEGQKAAKTGGRIKAQDPQWN
jgi:tetratricopeptide (TPR) repeat protein